MAPIRLGIAGAGIAALQVLPSFAAVADRVHLTALADTRRDNLDYFRDRHGEDLALFDDALAMCASDAVDALWIATPNELHAAHVIAAADNGKHVICEKPMAVTLDQCRSMVDAVERNGVKYVQGHSKVYDTPVRRMGEIVQSGALGRVLHIQTWNFNDWLLRAMTPSEVETDLGSGPVFRQGPHQVDIVRFLGGGMVRSLRAVAGQAEPAFPGCEGHYTALVEFEGGAAATLVFDGYGFFDTVELTWGRGESGRIALNPESIVARERPTGPVTAEEKYAKVRAGNPYGYGPGSGWDMDSTPGPPFFGLTVVACERGVVRQSPDGVYVYDADGRREVPCPPHHGRTAELVELYDAVTEDRAPLLDARWGMATTEVCLAIIESSRSRSEVVLSDQVASPDLGAPAPGVRP